MASFREAPSQLINTVARLPTAVLVTLAALILATSFVYGSLISWDLVPLRGPPGCRRVDKTKELNLDDEFKNRYHPVFFKSKEVKWRVKALVSHPVKSCREVELDSSTVDQLGLKYDRRYLFAIKTSLGWKFITQREVPALATVRTEIWAPTETSGPSSREHPHALSDGVIALRWLKPGLRNAGWFYKAVYAIFRSPLKSVYIPYNPSEEQIRSSGYIQDQVTVWKDKPMGHIVADDVHNDWIRHLKSYLDTESRERNPPYVEKEGETPKGYTFNLNRPFALFRLDNQQPREVMRNAPRKEEAGYQPTTAFQDAYPLSLQNLASVRVLGSKLTPEAPSLSVKNFRGNIILEGGPAFDEDTWKMIRIGDYKYYVTNHITRCPMPNIDQITGVKDRHEPSETMKTFRQIDDGAPGMNCFGMHMVPVIPQEATINVGDEVEILQTGSHKYILQ